MTKFDHAFLLVTRSFVSLSACTRPFSESLSANI